MKLPKQIKSISFDSSEITLSSVALNGKTILSKSNNTAIYFEESNKLKYFKDNGYSIFGDLFGLLKNSVLLLDNNRYFKREYQIVESKSAGINPEAFKNWLFNQYLTSETHEKFLELKGFIQAFNVKDKYGTKTFSPLDLMDMSFTR